MFASAVSGSNLTGKQDGHIKMNTITLRYNDVMARIENAAGKSGRAATDITLVAVSKTFAADDIEPVFELGHRH